MSEEVVFGGRRYEVYDLSQHLSNSTSDHEPMRHTIEYYGHIESAALAEAKFGLGSEYWPNGEVWANEVVTLSTHSGTHIDAPYHYAPKTAAGEDTRRIDAVPLQWVMSDAFCLELMHCDRVAGITEDDVAGELDRIGYEPKENDIALIRTDTSKHFGEPGYDLLHPGLRRSATKYLVEHGVRLIGIDAWGIDRAFDVMAEEAKAGDKPQLWESHKFGAEQEYSQIEKLCNLDTLPRPHGFSVMAVPVGLEAASAAWARVVALYEITED